MKKRLGILALFLVAMVCSARTNGADATAPGKSVYRGLLMEMTGDDKAPVKVWDAEGNPVLDPFYDFARKGLALVDRDYSLRLEGGRFFSAAAEEYLGANLRQAEGQFTLAAYVLPGVAVQKGAGLIIGYGPAGTNLLFELAQEGDALALRIGPPDSAAIKLATLKSAESFHLVLTVNPTEIVLYQNGKKVGTHAGFKGNFSDSKDGMLFFGNNEKGTQPWRGRLQRVSIYNQALDADKAGKLATALLEEVAQREPAARVEIEGTLTARSTYTMPWKEGFTYREVLSICEYKVNKVISGDYKGAKIRVAEWMYVDRIFLTNSIRKPGESRRMLLEPLDANPQLSTTQRDDTLDLDMDAVVYYDLSPIDALPEKEQPKPPKEKAE